MNTFGFAFVSAGLFAAAFGGTWYVATTPGAFDFGAGVVDCDARTVDCRARLRAQGEKAFARGDVALGDAALRRAALGGDLRAAFHLGWHHEEAYRRAVGGKLEAGTGIVEESQPGIAGLPRGADFLTLTKRWEDVPAGPARPLADRTLAFLWYGWAANAGFGPAMNNLGALYQFGITGTRDRFKAQAWYERAAQAANPVGKLNNAALRIRYGEDCDLEQPIAFTGGFVAPPGDLEEDVVTRTRFRGKVVPSALRGMFRVQSQLADTPPDQLGVFDAIRMAAMLHGGGTDDFKQDWDDAEEVAAVKAAVRDCREARRRQPNVDDQRKLERLRAEQAQREREARYTVRRRY